MRRIKFVVNKGADSSDMQLMVYKVSRKQA